VKTLKIERPEFLRNIRKEIHWTENGFDLRKAPRDALEATIKACYAIGGGPTAIGNFLLANQLLSGSLVIVDQRVSRDLEVSKVVGDLRELAWPANSMEMRFADLPAIIVCSDAGKSKDGETVIAFGASSFVIGQNAPAWSEGAFLTLALPISEWQRYLEGDPNEFNMDAVMAEDLNMDPAEGAAMKYLAALAIKVIAYASVPIHRPVEAKTKAEKKAVGLHPKHIIKDQKTLVVRYLPHVVREPTERTEAEAASRRFLGRAGYIRHYKSDFYKNVKGQWRWMPPIPPPEGVQVVYKIREVKP
jgi:hypothetical protein